MRTLFALGSILALVALFAFQCTEKYPASHRQLALSGQDGCVGCHTNSGQLKKVATPLPPTSGEAGEG